MFFSIYLPCLQAWKPFLGFNRDVPSTLVPERFAGRWCVLVSRVLPMGFANSVAIAQHIHRNVVRWSAEGMSPPIGGEGELRKDMAISAARKCYSYGRTTCPLGCPGTLGKLLKRQYKAEIQGALFDGLQGFAMPKVSKVWQDALLAVELLQRTATLKELQVVCGGFVYMAMFRRPLLSGLNEVWSFNAAVGSWWCS